MSDSVFDILDGEELNQFNRGRGRQITYSQDPDVEYNFPETDIEIYSHKPTFTDVVHPFRPSSEYLVQAVFRGHFYYFEGSEKDVELLDRKFTDRLGNLDGSEYYKKINTA